MSALGAVEEALRHGAEMARYLYRHKLETTPPILSRHIITPILITLSYHVHTTTPELPRPYYHAHSQSSPVILTSGPLRRKMRFTHSRAVTFPFTEVLLFINIPTSVYAHQSVHIDIVVRIERNQTYNTTYKYTEYKP